MQGFFSSFQCMTYLIFFDSFSSFQVIQRTSTSFRCSETYTIKLKQAVNQADD